jgi:hypothetical protein
VWYPSVPIVSYCARLCVCYQCPEAARCTSRPFDEVQQSCEWPIYRSSLHSPINKGGAYVRGCHKGLPTHVVCVTLALVLVYKACLRYASHEMIPTHLNCPWNSIGPSCMHATVLGILPVTRHFVVHPHQWQLEMCAHGWDGYVFYDKHVVRVSEHCSLLHAHMFTMLVPRRLAC